MRATRETDAGASVDADHFRSFGVHFSEKRKGKVDRLHGQTYVPRVGDLLPGHPRDTIVDAWPVYGKDERALWT